MKIKLIFFAVLNCITSICEAQNITVYPTHWWVGMKNKNVQLLVHNPATFGSKLAVSTAYSGVQVTGTTIFANRQYIAINLNIANTAKAGAFTLNIKNANGQNTPLTYTLKPRRTGNGTTYAQGLTCADLMYLILPDRYSNGDESNDRVAGMQDQSLRRDTVYNRHGGDLKGIQNHLNYFTELGITALWLNPVIVNDMPTRTEHGYSFTNHYQIEPRLGGEAAYLNLINAAHKKGIKIIQDAVYNHVGSEHILFKNLPDSGWFHWANPYVNTNYKDQTLFDPYTAKGDIYSMERGWFTPLMPDWNHDNTFVQNYLTQHAIWTVEEFGIDAWRIDTYGYNNLTYMNKCNAALLLEYPKIFMFGETWVHGIPNQSYLVANNYNLPFKSNLQGVTDFQQLWGIKDALTKDNGWTDGNTKLYTITAQDFVYKNAYNNVVFLDNHDMNRFYSELNENMDKYKIALGWLLTTRGIPQLYYGNEIATTGVTSPNDGYVRLDFMGGWVGDANNKFEANGRNEKENDVFNYIKLLGNYRKNSKALTTGKLTQYVPYGNSYIYFRSEGDDNIMVVMNTGKTTETFATKRFAQNIGKATTMKNIITKKQHNIPDSLRMEANSILIAEIK